MTKEHDDYFSALKKHDCIICYWFQECKNRSYSNCDNNIFFCHLKYSFRPISFGEFIGRMNRVYKIKEEK